MCRPCSVLGNLEDSATIDAAKEMSRCSSWFDLEAFVFMPAIQARAVPARTLSHCKVTIVTSDIKHPTSVTSDNSQRTAHSATSCGQPVLPRTAACPCTYAALYARSECEEFPPNTLE